MKSKAVNQDDVNAQDSFENNSANIFESPFERMGSGDDQKKKGKYVDEYMTSKFTERNHTTACEMTPSPQVQKNHKISSITQAQGPTLDPQDFEYFDPQR